MKKMLYLLLLLTALIISPSYAESYQIDAQGSHTFIDFRVKHIGISWLSGNFNKFSGHYSYDEHNPEAAKVNVTVDVSSIDTNYINRDEDLRSKKYFDVLTFPYAYFISTSFEQNDDGTGVLWGDFTLHGVTKSLKLNVEFKGNGADSLLGNRRGFTAKTSFRISDYGIDVPHFGPFFQVVYLTLSV